MRPQPKNSFKPMPLSRRGLIKAFFKGTLTSDIRTFEVDRSFAALSKWAPWLLIAFVLLFVALPFLPNGDRPSNNFGTIGLSVFGVIFFGVLGWYGFRIAKQLPQCSVSVDRDGLWLAHLSKERSLIRWEDVHSTREHMYLQRLDLLDKKGHVLIKVEYQLSGFETLRALLLEKISLPTQLAGSGRFAKRPHLSRVLRWMYCWLLGTRLVCRCLQSVARIWRDGNIGSSNRP